MVESQDATQIKSDVCTTETSRNNTDMYITHYSEGLITYSGFEDACLAFIHRCHDKAYVGSYNFAWKGESGCHYLSILRYLSPETGLENVAKPPTHDPEDTDKLLSFEDDDTFDEVAVHHSYPNEGCPCVEYHILHSPSYQVPVLYLHLHQLSPTAPQGFDTPYQWLVPMHVKNTLRGHGIVGGISMANHPVTDLPAYFIHPCNTAKAIKQILDGRSVLPLEYLQIWFGLVGSAVGLYLPKNLVIVS